MHRARRLVAPVLALFAAVILGIGSVLTSAVALAATTGLIVPGTGTSNANLVDGFLTNVRDYYLGATSCDTSCDLQGINYPASLWPLVGGLQGDKWDDSVGTGVTHLNGALIHELTATNDDVVIYGFSQGAAVVSNELRNLTSLDNSLKQRLQVVIAGNPYKPNGGIFTRLGFLQYIPGLKISTDVPTPTDTTGGLLGALPIPVTDIAFEYDPVGDAPAYPLNVLAMANALLGLVYIHTTYIAPNGNTKPWVLPDGYTNAELQDQLNPLLHPENFQYYNNTTYITIPTKVLPIMQPLIGFGKWTGTSAIVTPIVDLVSPALRVMIDTGYDRTASSGQYTTFGLIPRINPITFTKDLIGAIQQGIHDAGQDIAGLQPPSAPALPASSSAAAVRAALPKATPKLTAVAPAATADHAVPSRKKVAAAAKSATAGDTAKPARSTGSSHRAAA
ncbi:PE-PPE domain-containing protein [Mycobacterium sp. RTGN5]|uniref:PE-PPE domain-containing protein n=1 Tax=Mycobacterium sp. RTGN5 TaxID=3016522 RepID=UPI0029C816B9|nr:PE-PPE domain-containing protein [Mycobacterium sp. RTGN5]